MDEVRYELAAGVARITIERPEQRNALDRASLVGMREAIRRALGDPAARVVTVTGSGDRVFCAGADLKAALAAPDAPRGDFGRAEYRALLVELVAAPKPTVALVRGHVMAGGLGIVLACDLALACDDVQFSTPEIHVGMFPMMVLALLLRHAGRKAATELVLLGERISADEARALGLVNRVLPRASFDALAEVYTAQLASKSAHIVRRGKDAIRGLDGGDLPGELERLEVELERLMASDDSREGIRAFVEKRTPRWSDR